MLSISAEARDFILARNETIHLDMPPFVRGNCCGPSLQECPTVRFGPPPARDHDTYEERTMDGVTVFVPKRMANREGNFTITVASFLGRKRVVLEGWSLL